MPLQVKRAGADEYGRHVKALICGEPGSGKTRTSSTWKNPLIASAEGGLMSVADRQTPYVNIASSADVRDLLQALDQSPEVREKLIGVAVDTVIVDTIDEVGRILIKERLTEKRAEILAMQDWGWYGDQLRGIIRAFRNLPLNVVFTCHTKTTEDSETGRVTVKPQIQGAVGDEIAGYFDLAVLMRARPVAKVVDGESIRETQRYMQTYPDLNVPWLKDRSGKLQGEFPITLNDDFERIYTAIFGTNGNTPAGTEQVATLATAPAPEEAPPAPAKTTPAKRPPAKKAAAPAQPALETEPAAEPVQGAGAVKGPPPPIAPDRPAAGDAPFDTADERAAAALVDQITVPDAGTADPDPEPTPDPAPQPASEPADDLACESCGNAIENADQADLSRIRFRKALCRPCFVDHKEQKKR